MWSSVVLMAHNTRQHLVFIIMFETLAEAEDSHSRQFFRRPRPEMRPPLLPALLLTLMARRPCDINERQVSQTRTTRSAGVFTPKPARTHREGGRAGGWEGAPAFPPRHRNSEFERQSEGRRGSGRTTNSINIRSACMKKSGSSGGGALSDATC